MLCLASNLPLSFAGAAAAASTRAAIAPRMGLGFPSPKELAGDPPISETLRIAKAEQVERMARLALMGPAGESFIPGGDELMLTLAGAGPMGFFDPLNLTPECKREVVLWREAELMHGRVSMLAAVGFFVQEAIAHPIMPDSAPLAINQLGAISKEWAAVLFGMIWWFEIARAEKGWNRPDFQTPSSTARTVRTLRQAYEPGNLGFDPLRLKPTDPKELMAMQNKELNNGRLAMIAVAGFVGQELATSSPVFGVSTAKEALSTTAEAAAVVAEAI